MSPDGKAQERNLCFRGALPPGSPPASPAVTVPSGTFQDSQVLTYQHGVPTSLRKSDQQWDYPNAWAPLQDLVIRGRSRDGRVPGSSLSSRRPEPVARGPRKEGTGRPCPALCPWDGLCILRPSAGCPRSGQVAFTQDPGGGFPAGAELDPNQLPCLLPDVSHVREGEPALRRPPGSAKPRPRPVAAPSGHSRALPRWEAQRGAGPEPDPPVRLPW